MAQIHNSDLTKEIIGGAKIQTSHDRVPSQIAEKVVPVMEVNPDLLRKATLVKTIGCINATAATIYTTSATKDTYLTGASLSWVKDASAVAAIATIRIVRGGVSEDILALSGITLTANSSQLGRTFNPPIKLDRNSTVRITINDATAAFRADGCMQAYEVED